MKNNVNLGAVRERERERERESYTSNQIKEGLFVIPKNNIRQAISI